MMKTLRDGWKSLFYKDRYCLIAKYIPNLRRLVISNRHEFTGDTSDPDFIVRRNYIHPSDGNKIEVTVIDLPNYFDKEEVFWHLTLTIKEWFDFSS